ncbi:MAG: DUF368 domain-containing protein [Pleomorphochaeta sp.]
MINNSIKGFCMALADSIPGVSGGTIAYILGFYDKFLSSLNNIFSRDKNEQKSAITFLVQLIFGWLIGFILSILILSTLFTNQIYFMSSLLIGLTLSSIPLILKEEKNIFNKNIKDIIKYTFFFILGFIIVIYISTNSGSSSNQVIDLKNLTFLLSIKLFFVGMLAIATMILPGISGSSLLVIFKLYLPIINALKEFFHFNFTYFFALFIFGCGILFGAITTVKIVKTALKKYRASTLSFIIGLILAAVYSIILGPTTLEIPKAPLSLSTFNIIGFSLGVLIIFTLHKMQARKKDNN